MNKIHIIGENTGDFKTKVCEIAAKIVRKQTGEEIFTIVKKPGINMQLIESMEEAWIKLVVCGVDAQQSISDRSPINYIDMSKPDGRNGRHQTFDSISELNEYLAKKCNRLFVIGRSKFCNRVERFMLDYNDTLPPISHKKIIKMVLE